VDIERRFDRRPLDRAQMPALAVLVAAVEATDHPDEFLDEGDLSEFLDDPDDDYERGSMALYDGDAMIGYAVLGPRTAAEPVHLMRLDAAVHPDFRGQGIGGYLIDWAERAATPLHAERFPGHPLSLAGSCQESNKGAVDLFAGRGYQPSRWFLRMTCELAAEPPAASIPPGVRIVPFTKELSADARQVHDEAFRDHWGSVDSSEQGWDHFISFSAFRPQYSFLAYAEDEPLALVIAHDYDSYTKATGLRDLYIPVVGTRRKARGRGLATALLATALHAAWADGFVASTLDVDADSPTGAGRIYERAGYAVRDRWITMVKELVK
jgi:mycothiol synthase